MRLHLMVFLSLAGSILLPLANLIIIGPPRFMNHLNLTATDKANIHTILPCPRHILSLDHLLS